MDDRRRRLAGRFDGLDGSPFTPAKELDRSPRKVCDPFKVTLGKLKCLINSVENVDLRGDILDQLEFLVGLPVFTMDASSLIEARISIEMDQTRRFLNHELAKIQEKIPVMIQEPTASNDVWGRKPSFADKVKVKLPNKKVAVVNKEEKVVLVYPKTYQEGSEEAASSSTKAEIKKVVVPRTAGIQIAKVRNIAKGGVAVTVQTSKQAENLKARLASPTSEGKFTVKDAKGKNPRIKIFDVPSTMNEDELRDCIYGQNLSDYVSKEVFVSEFKTIFKTKPDEHDKVSWIVSCSPEVRSFLVKKVKIGIDWFLCKVRDFTAVTRCFKCNGFGHTVKFCKNQASCGKCAEGHETRDCTYEGSLKCSNCKRYGKPHDHGINDANCPCLIRASEMSIKKINYGD